MKKYINLIRVKHWIKNLLVFIPLICAKKFELNNILSCIIAFFSFSFLSSFIYVVNDIRDIEKDKLHPIKKKRPLASGEITKPTAIIIAALMLILSLAANVIANGSLFNVSLYFLLAYFIVNLGYSFGLKNVAILDVVLLATGFILRVYYGASIINVEVSDWLFLTILNASLFMGLGKRKKELVTSKDSRKVLSNYTESFLDKFQYMNLSLTVVFYSLWAIEQTAQYLYLTIPLVLVILMRYCLIIESSDEGDPTTVLYKDKTLLLLCIVYGISMIIFFGVL